MFGRFFKPDLAIIIVMARIHREKYKTYHQVFDEFTNLSVLKLISKGHLDGLEGPVKMGKESNVFTGLVQNERVAVKIYRINTCDFNRMYEYIRYDPRFPVERKRRKVVLAWAQREYRNLLKAREASVRVPAPRAVLNNVLVMEFVGTDNTPAPQLKDVHPKNLQKFFEDLVNQMRKLYKAGMVHADLSHFNILNHNNKPVLIDFSQATIKQNPRFDEYFERDIRNVCTYFRKHGVDAKEEQVKQEITKN